MPRTLTIRLSLLQFLQFFVWGTWFVTAGTYFIQNLGFSGREVANIYASLAISATITPILLGAMADKFFSVEKLLAFLHILGGFLLLAVSYSTSFTVIYPVLFLYVLLYVPTIGLSSAICFHHIDDAKRDYPPIRVWGTIAWILAGVMVSYLNIEDQVMQFSISAACSIILGVYCLFLPHTPPQVNGKTSFLKSLKDKEIIKVFSDKSIRILVVSLGLISIPLSYYYSFVNPFLNELNIENAAGKMALGQVVEIFAILLLPWVFRMMRFKYIVFIGLLLWGIRYGMFSIGADLNQEWILLIALAIHGIAFTFAMLSVQIYFDTVIPTYLRATAQGVFSMLTMGIMGLIGVYIAGEFVNFYTDIQGNHDWASIWVFPSAVGLLVAIFFLLSFKSKTRVIAKDA